MTHEDMEKMITRIGERAAESGYKKQYGEFARRVYACILDSMLVKIRVADSEKNVGILDDICYETKDEIHAYQIKTSNVDNPFGYADFIDLLPKIVDSWRTLRIGNPTKKIYPYLWTDRAMALKSPVVSDGKRIDYFPKFKEEVLDVLKQRKVVTTKWEGVLEDIKAKTYNKKDWTLTDDEWSLFWSDFDFATDKELDLLLIERAKEEQRKKDLLDLEELIRDTAASKNGKVELSKDDIYNILGWNERVNPTYDHHLEVENAYYVPNQNVLEQLNTKVLTKTKGYVFLEGAPGSGKSTILTKWAQGIANRCISYYAFDFTRPSHQYRNDYKRGESLTFLFDLCTEIQRSGIKIAKKTLLYKDEAYLQKVFISLLNAISEDYKATNHQTIIIVDGLDHVHREYTAIHGTSLLHVLPSVGDLPDGVIFVLGSQYYEALGLNAHTIAAYGNEENTIKMPALSEDEIGQLAEKVLGEKQVTDNLKQELVNKSNGHPLYLRYILNQIKEDPTIDIETIPGYEADIEVYYNRIIGNLLDKKENREYVGLLARVSGDIKDDWVREWDVSQDTHRLVLKQMGHLFVHDKRTKTRSLFHNSFRQYLIRKTAYDYISESYSEEMDREYYLQLANLVRQSKVEKNWSVGYYLYKAEADDLFTQEINPDRLIEQVYDFRPIWHVKRDVEFAVRVAARNHDVYKLARMLLFQRQIEQMELQDHDASVLIKDFMQLGEDDIAKCQIQEGKELHCSDIWRMRLSRTFYMRGDIREAEFLFDSLYPNHKKQLNNNSFRDRQELNEYIKLLQEWVRTAVYFREVEKIEEDINKFVQQLNELVGEGEDSVDVEEIKDILKQQVVDSLVELRRWDSIEPYIQTYPEKEQNIVRFYAQREKLECLIQTDADKKVLQSCYTRLQNHWDAVTNEKSSYGYLEMATGAYQTGADKGIIKDYLDRVNWNELEDITRQDRSSETFDKLSQRIQYVELRTYVGYDDDLKELEPDPKDYSDEQSLIYYKRMVYRMAQLKMKANRDGVDDKEFMSIAEDCLTSFDAYIWMGSNVYAYMINRQRGAFYKYLVGAASNYGRETISKVSKIVQELHESETWKADASAVRMIVCALYNHGMDEKWTRMMLEKIEDLMFANKDLYEKQAEAIEQGRAWMMLKDKNRAMQAFKKMIVESLGVGYRKDFQPTTMAGWICTANQADKEHALERIHWMTSRLKSITQSCEKRTAVDAGLGLYKGTLNLNLGMGVQLGEWLLDNDLGYIESISSGLIEKLLKRVRIKEEYDAVFAYFTQVHLCTMGDWSDVDTRLLEQVYIRGVEIIGTEYEPYIKELHRCISTLCYEKAQKELNNRLDELQTPKDNAPKKERDVDNPEDWRRNPDRLLAKAKALLEQGEREEAWNTAIEALESTNSMGWATFYDGGTRLNACALLKEMDEEKGKQIALQQIVSDAQEDAIYGITGGLHDIVELLTDEVDEMKLYDVEQEYMNQMMRGDMVREEDKPLLRFIDEEAIDTLTRWMIYVTGVSANGLSDRAKMLLAKMAHAGYGHVAQIMKEEQCDEWKMIEIGMYVRELGTNGLSDFRGVAKKNMEVSFVGLQARAILRSIGEPVPEIYDEQDNVAGTKDFSVIHVMEQPKPTFIPRMTKEGEWSVHKTWESETESYARLVEHMIEIDEGYVIGEKTYQCKPGDNPATEQFDMMISGKVEEKEPRHFFGKESGDEIIIEKEGYGTWIQRKAMRIMINPRVARQLGWSPCEEGYSAWKNQEGEKMAESIYWQNGNTYYHGRSNIETGEGWYVWASKKAMEALRTLGIKYIHRREERSRYTGYSMPAKSTYVVMEIEKEI